MTHFPETIGADSSSPISALAGGEGHPERQGHPTDLIPHVLQGSRCHMMPHTFPDLPGAGNQQQLSGGAFLPQSTVCDCIFLFLQTPEFPPVLFLVIFTVGEKKESQSGFLACQLFIKRMQSGAFLQARETQALLGTVICAP